MPRNLRAVTIVAILGALMLPSNARAAQLDARENPERKGPIVHDGGNCSKDVTRSGGDVAAKAVNCSDVYAFNPAREGKARRVSGVVWLQTSVDTSPGICSRRVEMALTVPDGVRIEKRSPSFKRTDDRRRVTTRIRVRAGGTAEDRAVVKNEFWLYPNRIKPNVEGHTMTMNWRGNTARDLGFAMGVEVSWDATEGFPNAHPVGAASASLATC